MRQSVSLKITIFAFSAVWFFAAVSMALAVSPSDTNAPSPTPGVNKIRVYGYDGQWKDVDASYFIPALPPPASTTPVLKFESYPVEKKKADEQAKPAPVPVESPIPIEEIPPDRPRVELIEIGSLRPESPWAEAYKANAKRQVVGMSMVTNRPSGHAFLWENGVMKDLVGFNPNGGSAALDINDKGQVVGYAALGVDDMAPYRAFLWQNGKMRKLGMLKGCTESRAYGINNNGQIVGECTGWTSTQAWLWQNGVMKKLPSLGGKSDRAFSIDENGAISGRSEDVKGKNHTVVWENGRIRINDPEVKENKRYERPRQQGEAIYRGQLVQFNDYLSDVDRSIWHIGNISWISDNGMAVGDGGKNGQMPRYAILVNIPEGLPLSTK